MRVSIALATFNGKPFLAEQLESLVRQTRIPDEIVVSDDGSTDETLHLVRAFANQHPAIEVRMLQNASNLGYAANFVKAMEACDGEVIFLCDQDDVWLENKIETVVRVLREKPDILLVVNNADVVDASLRPAGKTLHQQLKAIGMDAEDNCYGCCMAFRRTMLPIISPVPVHLMGHDTWINLIAVETGTAFRIDRSLQLYRRHGANASSGAASDIRGASRLKVFISKFRARKDLTAVSASMSRIEQLEALGARLSRDHSLLAHLIGDSDRLDSAINATSGLLKSNRSRLGLQQRPFLSRLIVSTHTLISGGYRDFEGIKSWARDVIG